MGLLTADLIDKAAPPRVSPSNLVGITIKIQYIIEGFSQYSLHLDQSLHPQQTMFLAV
jgi:hypothetical protein